MTIKFEPATCFKCSAVAVHVMPGVHEFPAHNARCEKCGAESYMYVVTDGQAPEAETGAAK